MRNMLQLCTDKVERDSQAWIQLWLTLFSAMYELDVGVTKEVLGENLWNSRLDLLSQSPTTLAPSFFASIQNVYLQISMRSINQWMYTG